MTDKHTPGPWTIHSGIVPVSGQTSIDIKAGIQATIPVAALAIGSDQEANARLIAAAPELLSACQEALITVSVRCKIEGVVPDASPTVLCLQAAIKAAKGDESCKT